MCWLYFHANVGTYSSGLKADPYSLVYIDTRRQPASAWWTIVGFKHTHTLTQSNEGEKGSLYKSIL
jgi:hypothetical protein